METNNKSTQMWTVRRGDKTYGPFSPEQLRNLANSGKLKQNDLVRLGDGGWQEAASLTDQFTPHHQEIQKTGEVRQSDSSSLGESDSSGNKDSLSQENPSSSAWYYAKDQERIGPVTWNELLSLATSDQIAKTDLVWTPGTSEWSRADQVEGLFPQRNSQTPPPLPVKKDRTIVEMASPGFHSIRMKVSGLTKYRSFRYIAAIGAISLVILILIGSFLDSAKIADVKNTRVSANPQYPIGDVLDSVCDDANWELTYAKKKDAYGEYTERVQVVRFTGITKKGKVTLQWIVEKAKPEFHWADLNGNLLSAYETATFFQSAFIEYERTKDQ